VAAARAASLAESYLAEVEGLQADWTARMRETVKRSNAAVWRLIAELPGHPIVSTAIARALTGRTKPRVQQAIDQLVAQIVLRPVGQGRRNRLWEADGLLDLLAGLEAGQPRR